MSSNQALANEIESYDHDTRSYATTERSFTTLVDTASNPIIYIGEAPLGSQTSDAKWRISKIDTGVTPLTIKYPGTRFDQIWDNRGSLNYQ